MDPRIKRVIRLMTTDPSRDLTLNELARAIHVSSSRLSHLFKAETGTSPMQYLKDYRMQKARELLETTLLRIKEVRLTLGFTDKSHFLRDFKRATGCTPSEYRSRYLAAQRKKKSHSIAGTATK